VSVYPDDGRTVQDLLEAADRQLYQRKRASRAHGVSVR
jgi:GGDEF domain-containing protein